MNKIYKFLSYFVFLSVSFVSINQSFAESTERHRKQTERKVIIVKPKPKIVRRKTVIVVPRNRTFRNIKIVRRYGHPYAGYGQFVQDSQAWKWLAFTAISLKILDNLDEQAQREHEQAQITATTAPVDEAITWAYQYR